MLGTSKHLKALFFQKNLKVLLFQSTQVNIKMNEAQKIAKVQLKSATTGQLVSVEDFWANGPCVIHFMRRFGCQYCRLVAQRISLIKPLLDDHNVRLIGVGVENFGVEDFINEGFFTGELFVDDSKTCYKELGYKRYNWFNIWPSLLSKTSRDAYSASSKEGVTGNLAGDGLQMGGTLVVTQGAKQVLLDFKQTDSPGENVEGVDILRALSISTDGHKRDEKPIHCDQACEA